MINTGSAVDGLTAMTEGKKEVDQSEDLKAALLERHVALRVIFEAFKDAIIEDEDFNKTVNEIFNNMGWMK